MDDEQDIKLIGLKCKNELIEYGKLCGVICLENESVRAMYYKITGKPFEDFEDDHNRQKMRSINNKATIKNKCFYINFNNGIFNRFDIDKILYYNESGIFCEGEIKPKLDVLIFNISVIELDAGVLKEVKNFSEWLTAKNDYLRIQKISNFGEYYISFKEININLETTVDDSTDTKPLSKKELEKIDSDIAIENISKNLKQMVINERALDLLHSNTQQKVDNESYVIKALSETSQNIPAANIIINEDIVKTLPEVSTIFNKPSG